MREQEFEQAAEVARRRLRGARRHRAVAHLAEELARAERDLVEIVPGADAHAHGHEMDAEPLELLARKVGARIGHDRDAVVVRRASGLQAQVVRLYARNPAERRAGLEQQLGMVEMRVHAELLAHAGEHQARERQGEQRRLEPEAVHGIRAHHAFAAIAVQLARAMQDVGRVHAGLGLAFARVRAQRRPSTADVRVDALEQVDEAERAGIDHPGVAQDRELARGVVERDPGPRQRLRESAAEVAHVPCYDLSELVGERRQHREDGALARLRERLAGGERAMRHGVGELRQAQARRAAAPLRHALEELGHDRAGIPPGPVDRFAGEAPKHLAGAAGARPLQRRQRRAQGEREVRARVAVGNRKHVDAVDLVPVRDDVLDPADERAAQGIAGQLLHRFLHSLAACSGWPPSLTPVAATGRVARQQRGARAGRAGV